MKGFGVVPVPTAAAEPRSERRCREAKNAKEIAEALARVMAAQCTAPPNRNPLMCRVELLPTGQLLVEAPAAAQPQLPP